MKAIPTLVLLVVAAARLSAQDKFVTQVLIVPTFAGADNGKAHKASDIVRDRVKDAFPGEELRVVSAGDIADWLRKSGLDEDMALSDGELRAVAREFRADERITGEVTRTPAGIRVKAKLQLVRDLRASQTVSAEAPSVEAAALAVAREMIAARRQLVPLRRCENFARLGQFGEAARAASDGIAAYPAATFARVCLMTSVARLSEDRTDSVIAVARGLLDLMPDNALALEYLAEAYETKGERDLAGRAWLSLLATDTLNEPLLIRGVTALSRVGKARDAQPIIDHASDASPDNAPLLKLRWLVHLALSDWKGAIAAGEKMLSKDANAQGEPDFFVRFAGAYRADSQPQRALVVAAAGVARFPQDAPLYTLYVQLVLSESEVALSRGLARFPDNAALHAVAAQQLKNAGQITSAINQTRLALAAEPDLPHGYLQLADFELQANQPDSALAALGQAQIHGESTAMIGQFALAKGDALFRSASATKRREDFEHARQFLILAKRLTPSPEAAFLLGASALSVSQAAATEAPISKSCDLSKLAEASLEQAEENLTSGGSVAPDAAKQYLEFAGQLRSFIAEQVKTFCAVGTRQGPTSPLIR